MSWSVSLIGRAGRVIEALQQAGQSMSGHSKKEYEDAMPHLVGLVQQNFAKDGSTYNPPAIRVEASGSGETSNGEIVNRSCSVNIENIYGLLI